jgi:hypothetical protein
MGTFSRVSKTGRRVLSWTAAALVVALAVAVYLVERDGMAPAPRSLLGERPVFPRAWPRYAKDGEPAIGWRGFATRAGDLRQCGVGGGGAQRAWQYTLEEFGDPLGSQIVCTYKSELLARAVYKWQSLPGVAGEGDWPNFESWSETGPTPKSAATLESNADEWEIGCGLGDPDGACQVWIYRGRYGRAMMAAEFHFDVGLPGGGSRFEDVRVFFESLDDDLTRRLRRS